MTRVLVTGATGFIGRACIPRLLDAGCEVHAIARRAPAARDSVCWHACDLLAERAVDRVLRRIRPSHCLHLAWMTKHGTYWSSSDNLDWAAASLRLARALIDAGGERFVVAGSCAEYMTQDADCDETSLALAPHTLYGRCKHGLHLMLHSLAEQTDLSLAWGRVFYPYGPHQEASRLIPFVVRSLLRGERVMCHNPQQVCDWIHVDDVADALVALVLSDGAGTFNVSTGTGYAVNEVVMTIAALLDCRVLLDFDSSDSVASRSLAAWVGEPRRLRDECGWRPQFSLEAGLQHTVRQMRIAEGVVA